jgi:hypothetical protein
MKLTHEEQAAEQRMISETGIAILGALRNFVEGKTKLEVRVTHDTVGTVLKTSYRIVDAKL